MSMEHRSNTAGDEPSRHGSGSALMPEVMDAMASAVTRRAAPARRRRRWVFRGAGLSVALALVSGSALAASGAWNPFAGWNHHNLPSYTHARVSPQMLATLGVLRRPANARDHDAIATAVVQRIAQRQEVKINIDDVRVLRAVEGTQPTSDPTAPPQFVPGWLVLAPQNRLETAYVHKHAEYEPDAVCVYIAADSWPAGSPRPNAFPWTIPPRTRKDGTVVPGTTPPRPPKLVDRVDVGGTCGTSHDVRTRGLRTGGAGLGMITGLVPDGVAAVRATTSSGTVITTQVINNGYQLIAPPPQRRFHYGTLQWLRANGTVLRNFSG